MKVYRDTKETLKIEARLNSYIQKKRLPLDKKIGAKFFHALLDETPAETRAHYRRNGIPYYFEGICYTLLPA